MKRILYTILFINVLNALFSCRHNDADSAADFVNTPEIKSLSAAIKNANQLSAPRQEEIDSLKKNALGRDNKEKWETYLKISDLYRQLNADSSIYYAFEAQRLLPDNAESDLKTKGMLVYANALSTSGLFTPAIHIIDSLSATRASLVTKLELWKAQRILYSYMLAYVNHKGLHADIFKKRYFECDDSLLSYLPKSDKFYKFIYSERLVNEGQLNDALKNLQALIDSTPKNDNIYGMAAFQLAEVYKQMGEFKKYTQYLALSAESDIRSGVREGVALPTLADWLYRHGDIDNAFRFINFSLEEANAGNVRMRTITIVPSMPLIDEAYRKKIDNSKQLIIGYLIVAIILFLVAAGLSGWLISTIRRNHSNEQRLASSSKILEAYVGNFIGLCSNYATRLDQMAKLVTRKLASGQADELQKLVASGRFSDEDNADFYNLIDKAILDIFPDFVDSINTLLLPDKQITLKPDENLTPELRIYAFVRLGVDQGGRIAQILQYSVNTVYAYRNRMRNRAINRDTFDTDVKNLGHKDSYLNHFTKD